MKQITITLLTVLFALPAFADYNVPTPTPKGYFMIDPHTYGRVTDEHLRYADEAWEEICELVGVNPEAVHHFDLKLWGQIFQYPIKTENRVVFQKVRGVIDGSTIELNQGYKPTWKHEMLHLALGIKTGGNRDGEHKSPYWQKVVTPKDLLNKYDYWVREGTEIAFLGSAGAAGSMGYETPIIETSVDARFKLSDRFAIVASAGYEPRAVKVGVGDGWGKNYGVGLRTYFAKTYYVQFNAQWLKQYTSHWQKEFTYVGGQIGYDYYDFETSVGLYQDIQSFNRVTAMTYKIRWYIPVNDSESWGLVAGIAGSFSRFDQRQQVEDEWKRLTGGSLDALCGLFIRPF